jgi:hypothetical protein
MHRVILALTLATALAAPAFAEEEKTEREHAQPVQEGTVKTTPAQINDPDWTPCNYASEDDNGGCE